MKTSDNMSSVGKGVGNQVPSDAKENNISFPQSNLKMLKFLNNTHKAFDLKVLLPY